MFTNKETLSNYQLFYFESCIYCLRTRFALWRMGIKLKKKEILFNSANKTELLKGGGKSQVPCLRIEKNAEVQWLYESSEIISYFRKGLHKQ